MPFVVKPAAAGTSAVASIIVFGAGSRDAVSRIFRPKGNQPGKRSLGTIVYNDKMVDEAVAANLSPQESFLADETVFLFTHGNPAIVSETIRILVELGCIPIEEKAVPEKLQGAGSIDAIQREAYEGLLSVSFPRSVEMLCAAASGVLSDFIKSCDEDALKKLRKTAHAGIPLMNPFKIVLCGAPNAGKSTLFNHFVQSDRAIVSDVPGTTRDYIDETILIQGVPFVIEDTAGVGETQNQVDKIAQQVTRARTAKADVLICVVDSTNPVLPNDIAVKMPEGTIYAWNKSDIGRISSPVFINICALTGDGVDILKKKIIEVAGVDAAHDVSGPTIFTFRQLSILKSKNAPDKKKELLLKGA